MSIKVITIQEFMEVVKDQIEMEIFNTPLLVLGKTGIGKTEVLKQLAKELQIGYKEIRLINHTEVDLAGIPIPKEDSDGEMITKWAQMGRLPKANRDGEVGILVLDEITSCSHAVRTTAFQLLDTSRGVGDYKLPEKWLIVSMGNGPEDGGNYQGLEQAYITRCLCFRIEPNLESWKKWAFNNGVHPAVLSFFNLQADALWKVDIDNTEPDVYPTPRSWFQLSQQLTKRENLERKKKNLSANSIVNIKDTIVTLYACGCVGEYYGNLFSSYYKLQSQILSFEDIVKGKFTEENLRKYSREVSYLQAYSISYGIRNLMESTKTENGTWEQDTIEKVANCMKYLVMVGNMHLDVGIALMQDIQASYKEFGRLVATNVSAFRKLCPEFQEFVKKNKNVISD